MENYLSIQPGDSAYRLHANKENANGVETTKLKTGRLVSKKDPADRQLIKTTGGNSNKVKLKSTLKTGDKGPGNFEAINSKLYFKYLEISKELNEILSCSTDDTIIAGIDKYISETKLSTNYDKKMVEWLNLLLSKALAIKGTKKTEAIDKLINAGATVNKEDLLQYPLGFTNEVIIRLLDAYQRQNQEENLEPLYTSMLLRCFACPLPIDLVKKLHNFGVDMEIKNVQGHTLLHHAAINILYESSKGTIKALLEMGCNSLVKDGEGRIPLHYAASWHFSWKEIYSDDLKMVISDRQLLAVLSLKETAPESLDIKDNKGPTPMLLAYASKNIKIATELANSQGISYRTRYGSSLLDDIFQKKMDRRTKDTQSSEEIIDFIKKMITLGVDLHNRPVSNFTSWHRLLFDENDDMDFIEFLMDHLPKDQINTTFNPCSDDKEYEGYTALMYLIKTFSNSSKSLPKARILLQHGASATLENDCGKSALDIAMEKRRSGKCEIMKISVCSSKNWKFTEKKTSLYHLNRIKVSPGKFRYSHLLSENPFILTFTSSKETQHAIQAAEP